MKYAATYGTFRVMVAAMILLFSGAVSLRSQSGLPDIPDLIRVTVDHTDGSVLVQWEASTDPDIDYYGIWREQDGAFVRIATVPATQLEYKHMGGGSEQIAYAVTAVDAAGNESPFEQNVHRGVSLSVAFEPCTPSNILSWNAYQGWEGDISGYRIFGGIDPLSLQMLAFVSPAQLTWSHTGITTGTDYHYYIETVRISGMVSHSPIAMVSSDYPDPPGYLSVDYVSVIDASTVEIQFTADVTGPVNNFILQRRGDPGTPFSDVSTVTDAQQSTQVVLDHFPTSSGSYEYRVRSYYQPAECSNPIFLSESNPGTSILLTSDVTDRTVTLNWIPYRSYDEGISGYVIQRKSGNGEFFDIETVGPAATSWNEDIQSIVDGFQPGELQYRVVAIENLPADGNPGISLSNTVTVHVETTLRVPSAFTPGSNDMNAEFRPLIDFAPKRYLMMVLDRVGRKLFETTDPGEAWDGRSGTGDFVNEGVYVYYIQYTDHTGLFRSLTGNVTVLYP